MFQPRHAMSPTELGKPSILCDAYCKPGDPCPWCVERHGMLAWHLANAWEKRLLPIIGAIAAFWLLKGEKSKTFVDKIFEVS